MSRRAVFAILAALLAVIAGGLVGGRALGMSWLDLVAFVGCLLVVFLMATVGVLAWRDSKSGSGG